MKHALRLKLICSTLALLCAALATAKLVMMLFVIEDPVLMVSNLQCTRTGCHWVTDLLDLLGPVHVVQGQEVEAVETALTARVGLPTTALLLAIAEVVRSLPLVVLYGALAGAMLRFRKPEPFNAPAVCWLRRAAMAAAAMVIANPLAQSIQATAIMPVLGGSEGWRFVIIGSDLPFDIFLAGTLWGAVWALEEGRRVHEELAGYV